MEQKGWKLGLGLCRTEQDRRGEGSAEDGSELGWKRRGRAKMGNREGQKWGIGEWFVKGRCQSSSAPLGTATVWEWDF